MIRGSGQINWRTCHGYGPEDVTIEGNEIYDNEDRHLHGAHEQGVTITDNDIHDNGKRSGSTSMATLEPSTFDPQPWHRYTLSTGEAQCYFVAR